ncbi:MAG: hypothetical protein MUE73_12185, partial [Planctomycetes bacterium]|nr:hypothetical protein [Planctomycetota bacterium]
AFEARVAAHDEAAAAHWAAAETARDAGDPKAAIEACLAIRDDCYVAACEAVAKAHEEAPPPPEGHGELEVAPLLRAVRPVPRRPATMDPEGTMNQIGRFVVLVLAAQGVILGTA